MEVLVGTGVLDGAGVLDGIVVGDGSITGGCVGGDVGVERVVEKLQAINTNMAIKGLAVLVVLIMSNSPLKDWLWFPSFEL